MKVRKAVIPAAGYGTRLLPATKTIPKEMLPILNKPVIQYIVEGAVESGIEDVILVTSDNKKPLEDFFDRSFELEYTLRSTGKTKLLDELVHVATMANVAYVRQMEQLGNGHAVLVARHVVGDEPFVMLWGDDILLGDPPVARQLMDVAEKYDGPVVGVRRVPASDIEKYGILEVEPLDGNVSRAISVVEKPKREDAPSDLAQIGGFVLTPDIFDILENTKTGTAGEIYIADALVKLMQERPVYAYEFTGTRYDAGNKLGYLQAIIELSLGDPEVGEAFRQYLDNLLAGAAAAR